MRIALHSDGESEVPRAELAGFVREQGMACVEGGNLWAGLDDSALDSVARRMAQIRVLDSSKEDALNPAPFSVEVRFERRWLTASPRKPGVVYSGFEYAAVLREAQTPEGPPIYASPTAGGGEENPVVITTQRLATWGGDGWHLRTILLTDPVVISIAGLVEATARDREYYLLKQADKALGDQWLEKCRGRRLDYGDSRTADVLKGYLWQALFWSRNPAAFVFCENPDCALFNSHWQREMLAAQGNHSLCLAHQREWPEGAVEL